MREGNCVDICLCKVLHQFQQALLYDRLLSHDILDEMAKGLEEYLIKVKLHELGLLQVPGFVDGCELAIGAEIADIGH